MRSSFHTGFLTDLPVLDAIARVTGAGFDAVELNAEALPWAQPHISPQTPLSEIDKIARTGAVGSIAAHREGLASPDPRRRTEAVQWTVSLVKIAVDLGATSIHMIPGDEAAGSKLGAAGSPGEYTGFIESLASVVEQTGDLRMKIALEPIVNQLISTTSGALDVLRDVPGLGISFDPSHLHVTTHDVTDAAERLGERTMIAALKDATGQPDDFAFVQLGTGDIDFVSMVTGLRNTGFDGDLVVEHESHLFGDQRGIPQVLDESHAFVRDVIAKSAARSEA